MLLGAWKLIAADLLDIGIDVALESGVLQSRSGPWLRDAINGLMLGDTRLGRWRKAYALEQLNQEETEPEEV